MKLLTTPAASRDAAEGFVADHFAHLICDEPVGSGRFVGGQKAADSALGVFDVAGYASKRNEVYPKAGRGASALSPYIRHGLLPLREVWDHVADGPGRDVAKFHDELLWQEYSRHWYARLGTSTRSELRHKLDDNGLHAWNRDMACINDTLAELERDGWLVNQTRMWLASQWSVRDENSWRAGEDHFFQHLLDGSRAANRLGWQWTTGANTHKHYGFSRWQVEKRAPALCGNCSLQRSCPIQDWPEETSLNLIVDSGKPVPLGLEGPSSVVANRAPTHVWLTAESLGDTDPALVRNPGLPAVFVFDEPLLAKLQLSGKRLVFLVETLAELGTRRGLELLLGRPEDILAKKAVAVTHAPVPGFASRASAANPAEVHPWPWLCTPTLGPVSSFSAWRKSVGEVSRP